MVKTQVSMTYPAGRRRVPAAKKLMRRGGRYYGRRARNPLRPTLMSFPGYQFVPERMLTKLRYCFETDITSGQALLNSDTVFRANSIYDPEYAAGGGQPLGHDQLQNLYTSYKVHACRIRATFTSNGGVPTRICVLPTVSPTSFTAMLDACEQPYAKTKAIATYNGGLSSVKVGQKNMTKKILGLKDLDDDEEALFGADPVNPWYYHVHVSTDPYTSTNYIVGALYVELVYYVECFQRKVLARS